MEYVEPSLPTVFIPSHPTHEDLLNADRNVKRHVMGLESRISAIENQSLKGKSLLCSLWFKIYPITYVIEMQIKY